MLVKEIIFISDNKMNSGDLLSRGNDLNITIVITVLFSRVCMRKVQYFPEVVGFKCSFPRIIWESFNHIISLYLINCIFKYQAHIFLF